MHKSHMVKKQAVYLEIYPMHKKVNLNPQLPFNRISCDTTIFQSLTLHLSKSCHIAIVRQSKWLKPLEWMFPELTYSTILSSFGNTLVWYLSQSNRKTSWKQSFCGKNVNLTAMTCKWTWNQKILSIHSRKCSVQKYRTWSTTNEIFYVKK